MHARHFRTRTVLGLFIGLFAAVFGRAQAPPLPSDLDAIPRDATCFMHFRAAELWNHEVFADVRYLFKRAGAPTLKAFKEMFAPNPANIERFTLVMPTLRDFNEPFPFYVRPDTTSPLIIVRTKKPFDYMRVLEKLAFRDKFYRRHHYYFNEEDWRALVIIDARTFLIGAEQSVHHYFEQKESAANARGPLQAALEEAAGKHHFTIGINPLGFANQADFRFIPGAIQPAFHARTWTGTIRLDEALNLHARLEFADEKTAQAGEKACRAAIEMTRAELKTGIRELEEEFRRGKEKATLRDLPAKAGLVVALGFMREMDRILAEMPLQRQKNRVAATFRYNKLKTANHGIVLVLGMMSTMGMRSYKFADVAKQIGKNGKGDPRQQHLKRIAKALEKYHQDKGTYPAAAIRDKYGRPILSWRVALLPYFGDKEKQLYSQFRLDEPWDGPNNKKLIGRLPECYRSLQQYYYYYRNEGKTIDHAFTGKGTVFERKKGVRKKDVSPKTVLLLMGNTQTATYWTKPGDIRIEPGKPLPNLFPRYDGDMYAMLADGSFQSIGRDFAKKELRAMIYRKKGPVTADPEPKYPEAAWQDFIQIDDHGAKRALLAVQKLAAAPDKTLPFLKSKLQPVKKPDRNRIKKLITNLGSRNFITRERATKELTKMGIGALGALKEKLLDRQISLELHRRIEQIVKQTQSMPILPDDLRAVRAVLVLQEIGNAEAVSMLTELAQGADGAILTMHARKALRILKNR